MKKIIFSIIVSLITVIILLSFIDKTPQQDKNNTADIVCSVSSVPQNLKSVGNLSKREQDIICATSRGLVELNSDGSIEPVLAKDYSINDNGLEYIFKIRDDVYWSDGSKITSNDIVEFFREVITEEKELSALSYMDDTFGRTGNSLARPFVLSKIVELCHCRLQIPASEIWKL